MHLPARKTRLEIFTSVPARRKNGTAAGMYLVHQSRIFTARSPLHPSRSCKIKKTILHDDCTSE